MATTSVVMCVVCLASTMQQHRSINRQHGLGGFDVVQSQRCWVTQHCLWVGRDETAEGTMVNVMDDVDEYCWQLACRSCLFAFRVYWKHPPSRQQDCHTAQRRSQSHLTGRCRLRLISSLVGASLDCIAPIEKLFTCCHVQQVFFTSICEKGCSKTLEKAPAISCSSKAYATPAKNRNLTKHT